MTIRPRKLPCNLPREIDPGKGFNLSHTLELIGRPHVQVRLEQGDYGRWILTSVEEKNWRISTHESEEDALQFAEDCGWEVFI